MHCKRKLGKTIYFESPFRIAPSEYSNGSAPGRRLSSMPDETNIDSLSLRDDKPTAMDILVVEDNNVNQKLVKAMLQRRGHNVILA